MGIHSKSTLICTYEIIGQAQSGMLRAYDALFQLSQTVKVSSLKAGTLNSHASMQVTSNSTAGPALDHQRWQPADFLPALWSIGPKCESPYRYMMNQKTAIRAIHHH
jgi:hypothetical protein